MRAQQRLHEVDQIRDRDIPIHHHAFQLIERVFVRSVYFLVPENSSRRNHPQRRPESAHAAHLHRRRVGSQQVAVRQPEGILHIARRMSWRNVQRVEVMLFGLHFRTIQNRKAQRSEQVFDFVLKLRNRMQAARAECPARAA